MSKYNELEPPVEPIGGALGGAAVPSSEVVTDKALIPDGTPVAVTLI